MSRIRLIVLTWLVLGLSIVFALAPGGAAAKEWESDNQNVIVVLPDGDDWDWLPFNSAWGKQGIVRGAKRQLTKLKDGTAAVGQGALMHIAVRKAEEGATLASLIADQTVRDFLLKRFLGTNGAVDSVETDMRADGKDDGIPAMVLSTKGTATNLKGKKAPCEGILLVTLARGKLIMMRLYAFPTEFDDEGLSVDINYMEGNCLELITAKAGKVKKKGKKGAARGAKGGKGAKKGEGEAKDDLGEDQLIEFRAHRWRMTRDKKIKTLEITDDEKTDYLMFKAGEADQMGSYAFYIYGPPNTQYIGGVKAPPPNLLKWIGPNWWNHFTNTHPKGELVTWKWPKKPVTKGAKTWLTLPAMEVAKNRKVVFKAGKKRPVEVDSSDMIKKLGFVEKVKKNNLGKKGKAGEAVRGCMSGERPNSFPGFETVYRFAFRNREHSYRVFVTFSGKAYLKWGAAIRKTLESIEFGIKFRDNKREKK